MPTNKECHDYQEEIYKSINCRVKRWIFLLVVAAGASVLGILGRAIWTTTERANATEIRQQEQAKSRVMRERYRDEVLAGIKEQMQRMEGKLDKAIDRYHSRQ